MEGFYMNNKNILLAAAVLVAGQTYGAQPVNGFQPVDDLMTAAGVEAHVIGQRVQAENNAAQALRKAELERRNNLGTFSRVAEDIVINPITACGSMLYGGIKNIGFYSYHFLKYPLFSLGLVVAGRSMGTVLNKEITDQTFNKMLFGSAVGGAAFSFYQTRKDIAKVQEFKDLQKNNSNLKKDFNCAAELFATHANTYGNLQVIQQQIEGQTVVLQGLQGEQERTASAIKVAAQKLNEVNGQLNEINGQLEEGSKKLAGIESTSLSLLEGQFVTALHGLLTSAASLHSSYIGIQGMPQCDTRGISLQIFAQNLTVLNGLAEQAMCTIQELKTQYPDLYKKLQQRKIDSITAPLAESLSLLNQSGAPYLALDQAPVMQKALENREERDVNLLSLPSSSSRITSSTTTNTVSTVRIVPVGLVSRKSESRGGNLLGLSAPSSSTSLLALLDNDNDVE